MPNELTKINFTLHCPSVLSTAQEIEMKEKGILIPAILAALAVGILAVLIRNHQAHCPPCFHLLSFSPEVLKHFILATLIGIFPSILIQTFFTDRLSKFNWKDPTFMIALGAFILLGAVPAIYLKRTNRTAKATADNPSGAA